jgi:putative addiction module component (TIGR02574 family)
MSVTLQQFGIDRLSIAERLELAQAIWESVVAEGAVPPLTEAQQADLTRRLAQLDADPDNVLTWEQIKAHVRRGKT